MKLTGGKLVATTHRVNTLKIEKDRYVNLSARGDALLVAN